MRRRAARRGTRALWLRFAVLVLALGFATRAWAGPPDLELQVDTDVVGQGDDLHLTLQAMSDEGPPQNPSPGNTPGFTVLGSTSGPSQSISFINGRVSKKQGLNTTWTLHATRQGVFTLGPCSATIAGQRYSSQAVRVTVVAPGQAPQPGGNFFDPFGMGAPFDPFRGFFDNFPRNPLQQPQLPTTDPRLSLDVPRGKIAFLHSTVDRTSAVVGQQVTLSEYLYVEGGEHEAELNDVHEASVDDFVKRPLVEDDAGDKNLQVASVGGALYHVRLLRKWALFPLKSGDLGIGPMSLTLATRRGRGSRGAPAADQLRQSENLTVRVTEPPLAGRPPGYVVGDTGNFALVAETTPRDIEQEGAVGVTVDLSGTGNLPSSITPTARAGIEWLTPETHEKMVISGDRYGVKRTFAFVVRLHKAGLIDLGELALPYYNPDTGAYAVARATLGVVNVRAVAGPAANAEPAFDPFARLPQPRTQLSPARPNPTYWADGPLFWLGLGATPMAYALAAGAGAMVRRIRRRRAARAASPETDLKVRMDAAARACRGTDSRAADAAVARALHAATIAKVGINVRDAEGAEVSRRLLGAGVAEEVARQVEELIRDCEAARFSPEIAEMAAVRERWQSAQGVVGALRKST